VRLPLWLSTNPAYEKKCFIYDLSDTHALGLHCCPEVSIIINKGLTSFNQVGWIIHSDGLELPHGLYGGGGGVAKVLWDEQLADWAPSTSKSPRFQYNYMGTIDNTYYMAYSSMAYSSSTLATHPQPQDLQWGFMKAACSLKTWQMVSLHLSTAPVAHSQVSKQMNQLSKMTTPCQFTQKPHSQDQSPAQPTNCSSTQCPSTTWDFSTELKTHGTIPTVIAVSEDSLMDLSTAVTEVLGCQDEHIKDEIITAISTHCSSPIQLTSACQT